ncbi:hypothetical protein PoB_002603300 [Plakobranchus ocellatus]|uniref:EMI domain-containing protein n=1 Tax=Plakobranchus ocellatus TaxID=259542 RepID=A0AAV3ZXE0_9GAST|nr:hypothetical protein PoB_002603300 [Plakobranchus ocellatus]
MSLLSSSSSSSPSSTWLVNKKITSCLPYIVTLTVIMLCSTPVQSQWCTRLTTYTTIKPYVITTTCNQSYQESCGFFSFAMCTRYEEVPCMIEANKTVLLYKITESCCPGYQLDPISNISCMRIDSTVEKDNQEKVTFNNGSKKNNLQASASQTPPLRGEGAHSARTVFSNVTDADAIVSGTQVVQISQERESPSGVENATRGKGARTTGGSPNKNGSSKSIGEEGHDGRVEHPRSRSSGELFGLTNGAYAGIVSCLVLVLCVMILVIVRLHKRRQSNKLKKQDHKMEMEVSQKMIPPNQPSNA